MTRRHPTTASEIYLSATSSEERIVGVAPTGRLPVRGSPAGPSSVVIRPSLPNDKGFTAEERAAMRERARELKAEERANKNRAAGESAVLQKIAEMPEADRAIAERIHGVVKANAPQLSPKTWYGMPAYANKDGKVVCFFQSADKFDARYATLGFNDAASLDEGAMWPTSFALKKLGAAEETRIGELVGRAAG